MVSQNRDIDTLVVGAGQAGIAMSEHLSRHGVSHLVVERDRIAERWRTGRWDSLVANGPAWHDRFPGLEFDQTAADAFAAKDEVADYFAAYAEKFEAPVRTGVEVRRVSRQTGQAGFTVETSDGVFNANRVVAATGPFQTPVIPAIAPQDERLTQMHSADYRNPAQLPEGGVLVIGAGSSGVQIAEELMEAGRDVYLSVGPHSRPPRSYRGRDFCWWLGVLGKWDAETTAPDQEHVTIAVSGAHGGRTVDFRRLAERGMTLVGRTEAFENGRVRFEADLADNLAGGDADYLALLDAADDYVARYGLELPAEPEAREMTADPACVREPLRELDLAEAGITTIIWATGYTVDYHWLDGLAALDDQGRPAHRRGIAAEPGIYFLGLPWLSHRGSSFIWGVWHDAKRIADHIVTQRKYLAYHETARAGSDGESVEQAMPKAV